MQPETAPCSGLFHRERAPAADAGRHRELARSSGSISSPRTTRSARSSIASSATLARADEIEELGGVVALLHRRRRHPHQLAVHVPQRGPDAERHRRLHAVRGAAHHRRDVELPDFRLLRLRPRNTRVEAANPLAVMLLLFEQKVDHLADERRGPLRRARSACRARCSRSEETNEDLDIDIDDLAEVEDTTARCGCASWIRSAPSPTSCGTSATIPTRSRR